MNDRLTLLPLILEYQNGRLRRGEITGLTNKVTSGHLVSLARSHGARPVRSLGPAAIERWLGDIGHLAASTRRGRLSTVRGFTRWLVRQGHLREDPCRDVPPIRPPRTVPRALPRDHVAHLLRVAPDQRARVIVCLMVAAGLRAKEVSTLDVTDYDPRARVLFVGDGKGGHQREVAVSRFLAVELNAWLALRSTVPGPLVNSRRDPHQPLRPSTIGQMMSEWMWEAGIKRAPRDGVSGHALRHTGASDVLDQCGDLRVVQEFLGHRHLSSTQVYLRRAGLAKQREAVDEIDYRHAA